MMPIGEWFTPTRGSGIVAYGVAVTSSGIAWARSRALQRSARIASLVTVIEGALLFDMLIDGRWMLHQLLIDHAVREQEYVLRRAPQSIAVAILVGLLLVGLLCALRSFRTRIGALLAVSGVLLSLFSWCIEVVSLHAIDAILYHPVGKIMAVSIVWILACSMTSIGILIASSA